MHPNRANEKLIAGLGGFVDAVRCNVHEYIRDEWHGATDFTTDERCAILHQYRPDHGVAGIEKVAPHG